MSGTRTLLYKEVLRFWKVSFQTVAAPVLTAVLYLLIFGHVLEDHVKVFDRIGYTSFLIPGLVMMSVLQNAFANSSSSLIQSKITGNLVFVLVTPLSHWAWFVAYVGASIVRGLVGRGCGVLLVTLWFAPLGAAEPVWIVVFAVAGAAVMGALGLIAGLWAEKFDQIAAFQNFIVMPMTFLSGVFYSVQLAAGVLAGREPPEPVLLHHRRLSARLLRRERRVAVGRPGGGRREPRRGVRPEPAPAAHRLQDPPLRRPLTLESGHHGRPDRRRHRALHRARPRMHASSQVDGDGRHFFATIVSAQFEGASRIARHQLVYRALGDRMREQIHALSMKTLTPAEWAAAAPDATPSAHHHH